MTVDDERLSKIRANAAMAVERFRELSGASFGFDASSVGWVEGFIDRTRPQVGEEGAAGLVSVIGSYLGEAIIANTGGTWGEDDVGGLGVRFANGDTVYPFAKAWKQFEGGVDGGESILSFYTMSVDYVASGKLHEAGEGGAQ